MLNWARRRLAEARSAAVDAGIRRLDDLLDDEPQAQKAAMIDAEREELLRWRDARPLPDRDLRVLQRELDYEKGLL